MGAVEILKEMEALDNIAVFSVDDYLDRIKPYLHLRKIGAMKLQALKKYRMEETEKSFKDVIAECNKQIMNLLNILTDGQP